MLLPKMGKLRSNETCLIKQTFCHYAHYAPENVKHELQI